MDFHLSKQRRDRLQAGRFAVLPVLIVISIVWLGLRPPAAGAAAPQPPPQRRTQKPALVPPPGRLSPATTSAGNTNYYVDSVHGSDSQAGTSPDSAWASLSKLNSIAFAPGDTINLARGSTWTGSGASTGVLTINGAGAAGSPITVQDYGSGAAPTLRNPGGTPSNPSRVLVVQAPYVVVKNLLVRDTLDGGIYLATGADHALLQNNEATNVGIGFEIESQYNLITHNYAHDLTMVVNDRRANNDYGAEGVGLQAPNNEVSYNRFVNCTAPSYDYGTDGGAVEMYGTVDNSSVHHNYAFNDNGFVEVGGGSASNVTVAENMIVQSSPGAGLHAAGDGFASTYANFRFINNDVVDLSSAGGYGLFFIQGTLGNADQFVIRNSLFYVYNYVLGVQNDSNSPFTHDHNIWYFTGDYGSLNFNPGAGESVTDPKMFNAAGGDYHLLAGSPAIDAAVMPVAYDTDYGHNAIPYGPAPDMGIFEYAPGYTPPPPPVAHIGNLVGSVWGSANRGQWQASVTVTAHDPNHTLLTNVKVSAAWSGGYTGSAVCTTDGTGQCILTSNPLPRSKNETLTVQSLTYPASGGEVISGTSLTSDTGSTSLTVNHP